MAGFPRLNEWLGFLLAFIIALAVVNSVANRVPALARIEGGI